MNMTKKKEKSSKNTHKIHTSWKFVNFFFSTEKSIYDKKKKNLSKILINFIKIQNLTLTFKTSLHRS